MDKQQQALAYALQQSKAPKPIDLSGWTEMQLGKTVSIDTSNASGNCSDGSVDWMASHFPGKTSVTIREALTEAYKTRDRLDLVIRACRHAATL